MSTLVEAIEAQPPIIEDVALAIAEDAYPHLDKQRERDWLDQQGAAIVKSLPAEAGEAVRLEALLEHLYRRLEFHGNSDDYYDPRNSYLNEVIARRTGIPITLAVILMALGRRVGLVVEGIGFPGHFLVRVGGHAGAYVDPFNDGDRIERQTLLSIAAGILGGEPSAAAEQLEPVDARMMAVRMLFNLQRIYERRGDHAHALVVCDRLVDLTGVPFHRRDRGLHALALGANEAARQDFEAYLRERTGAPDAERILGLLQQVKHGGAIKPN
jgi:regulator of sirC expression with transglutaminase-like and TPR domain